MTKPPATNHAADRVWTWETQAGTRAHARSLTLLAEAVVLVASELTPPEQRWEASDVFCQPDLVPGLDSETRFQLMQALSQRLGPGAVRTPRDAARLTFWQHYDRERVRPETFAWVEVEPDGDLFMQVTRLDGLGLRLTAGSTPASHVLPDELFVNGPPLPAMPLNARVTLRRKLFLALRPDHGLSVEEGFPELAVPILPIAQTHAERAKLVPPPGFFALRLRAVDRAAWNHTLHLVFPDFAVIEQSHDWATSMALGLYASLRPDSVLPSTPLWVDEVRHQHSYNWKNDQAWLAPDGTGVLAAAYCFGALPGDGVNDVHHVLASAGRRVIFDVCTDSTQSRLEVLVSTDAESDLERLADEVEAYFRCFRLGQATRAVAKPRQANTDSRSVVV